MNFAAVSRSLVLIVSAAIALPLHAGGHRALRGMPGPAAVVHAGALLDRPGQAARGPSTIAISDGLIAAVVDGYQSAEFFPEVFASPELVEVIDLRDSFVLPGLMDAHVHIMAQPSTFVNNARNGGGPISKADLALAGAVYAQRTLAAGFTTVRDVGSNDQSVFALRDAINQGLLPGPTILASGPTLSATGGHGDRGFDASDSLDADVRRAEGVCDGATECAAAVRHNIKLGADLIKFTATGGFMSETGTQQQYELAEMVAIVDTAHMRGLKVAAHTYAADAARLALDAGVDSVEHGWLLDPQALKQMQKQGTYLVPTLLISRSSAWADMAGTGKAAVLRDEYQVFEKASGMGVKIAFGTDVGIYDHGQNALEFNVMVELGMSNADAIYTATMATADLFGLSAELGSLEAGKRADLIAVSESPLDDIQQLQAVSFVMKSGMVVKREGNYIGHIETRPVGSPVKF
jgi:imidazolonepropionase-like amidohydrolase